MKYRIIKRSKRFIPQMKKDDVNWVGLQEDRLDPKSHEHYNMDRDFASEKAAIDFIKEWHSKNVDTEEVVSELEL